MTNKEVVLDTIALSPRSELCALFYGSYNQPPSIESRANLFLSLPYNACVAVINACPKRFKVNLWLEACLETEVDRKRIAKLLNTLPAKTCYHVILESQDWGHDFRLLKSLSAIKIAKILELVCRLPISAEDSNVLKSVHLKMIRCFYNIDEAKRQVILRAVNKKTLTLIVESQSSEKQRAALIASCFSLSVNEVADLLSKLKPKMAADLLMEIKEQREPFFKNEKVFAKYQKYLVSETEKEAKIEAKGSTDITQLSRAERILFFKKFRAQGQFQNLTLAEQVDVIF